MLEWIGFLPLLGLTGNWRGYRMGGKAIGGASMSTDMKKKFEAARAAGKVDEAKAIADKAQEVKDKKKAEKAKKPDSDIAELESSLTGSMKRRYEDAKDRGDKAEAKEVLDIIRDRNAKNKDRADKGYKNGGTQELIQKMDLTANAPKSGAIKAWRDAPGDQQAALNAAHYYARKEKTPAYMFDGNSFMTRVNRITTDPKELQELARSSNRLGKAENGQKWAPAVKVMPDGKLEQHRIYIWD